ncbi:MAG TPA: hypothetical protein VLW45_07595 [Pelomicrobium sp.]|nr:hypothetical protein [Pelomicrobium sp.]
MLATLGLLVIAAVAPQAPPVPPAAIGTPLSVQEARLAAAQPVGRRFLARPTAQDAAGGLAFFELERGERRYFAPDRPVAFVVQERIRLDGNGAEALRVRFASGRTAYIDVRLFEFYLVPFYTFKGGAIVPE